jgi:hypothetical protein
MSCAISFFQWRTNGAIQSAPLMIGAYRKIHWRNGCAIMDFPSARQWRNGAPDHRVQEEDFRPPPRARTARYA